MLDSWDEPVYLTRLWCIYEQFSAVRMQAPMTVIMPRGPRATLLREINKGEEGIKLILTKLCAIDVENAKASMQQDEYNIKRTIVNSDGGFGRVNMSVKTSLATWVSGVVQEHLCSLIQLESEHRGFRTRLLSSFEIE
jgi:hypothetical protein